MLTSSSAEDLEQYKFRTKFLNLLAITSKLVPSLLEDSSDIGLQHMLWARPLDSNRMAASAGIDPMTRVRWTRTGWPRQLESIR